MIADLTSPSMSSFISPRAVVETTSIGTNVRIYEFAVVRANVRIGNDVVIHPHVVINDGTEIGDGVEVFPGAVVGKEPKGAGALSRTPVFERIVSIGNQSSIGPHCVIYYDVRIGEHTLIGDGASIREQCTIGNRTVIGRHVTINYNVQIGNGVKIMDHSWMAGNMRIGNSAFISGGVLTSNDNAIGKHGYSDDHVFGPTIEEGAMIGVGAKLLPNIVIGKNAVVGAGSVVTKSVEAGTVVMGVPATFVRNIS
jgi:acetyltransferase-like isoleucine patch superfamily enzyme